MRLLAPKRRRVLKIYWDGFRLSFLDESAADPKVTMVHVADGVDHLPESIPLPLASIREQNSRVRLFVSPDQAYVQRLRLPLAVLPHLDSAVALQLPKLLPLETNELLTDFEVSAKDSTENIASIDLAALKKADIIPVLERLGSWGLQVIATHLGQPSESHRFRFAADKAFGHRIKLRRSDRVLIGVAATLGLLCASLAAAESYRSHVSLEHAKKVTRAPASAALIHRQQLLARLEPLSALAQMEAAPSAAALLADVTMLIPQNTWLTTLELKDQHVRIVGVSPNSGNVVKLMSSSLQLNDVELRSSMSVGVGTGLDRFEITAQLKGREP